MSRRSSRTPFARRQRIVNRALWDACRIENLEGRRLLSVVTPNLGQWESAGPIFVTHGLENIPPSHEVSGAVNALAPDPGNADRLYIGTVNGGVWRVRNLTSVVPDWEPMTDAFGSLSIGAVTVDSSTDTVWAGVARPSSRAGDGGPLLGLIKGTDAWADAPKWTYVGPPELVGKAILGIFTAPMAAGGSALLVATDGGLYRSADGAASFKRIRGLSSGLPAGAVRLAADPADPNRFYAALPGKGVFISNDGGEHWGKNNEGLPGKLVRASTRIKLSVSDAGSRPVYAAFVDEKNQLSGVFRLGATNGTWTQVGTAALMVPNIHPGKQGNLHLSLLAGHDDGDPTTTDDDQVVFVGGDRQDSGDPHGNIYRFRPSTGWTQVVRGGANRDADPHADSRAMAYDASGGILEADDGGVFRMTIHGTNKADWEAKVNNLEVTEVTSLAYNRVAKSLLAGTQDNGVMHQTGDVVPQWTTTDGDGGMVQIGYSNGAAVEYFGRQFLEGFERRQYDNLAMTMTSQGTNTLLIDGAGGRRLNDFANDPKHDNEEVRVFDKTVQFLSPVAVNRVDGSRVLIGTDFLYESTDGAHTFTLLDPHGSAGALQDLTDNGKDEDFDGKGKTEVDPDEYAPESSAEFGHVNAIIYGGRQNGFSWPAATYVGTSRDLYFRLGEGSPFDKLGAYPGAGVVALAVNPENYEEVYATDGQKVFRSLDNGSHWDRITGDLDEVAGGGIGETHIRTIEVAWGLAGNGHDVVMVGTDGGAFRSRNPGDGSNARWSELGTDLPNAPVTGLIYDPGDHVLVAGTLGRGIFKLSDFDSEGNFIADQALTNETTLTIEGDATAAENDVTIIRNQDNPTLLDVTVNGTTTRSLPLESFEKILFVGTSGKKDHFTVDEARGDIRTPIEFAGEEAQDTSTRINSPHVGRRFWRRIADGIKDVPAFVDAAIQAGAGGQDLPLANFPLASMFSPNLGTEQPSSAATGANAGEAGRDDSEDEREGEPDAESAPLDTLGDVLHSHFVGTILDYLRSDQSPTVGEFVNALKGISVDLGPVTLSVDPDSVGDNSSDAALEFVLDLTVTGEKDGIPLDLGTEADALGLSLDASALIDVSATLDFQFVIGLNLDETLPDDQAFYIRPQSFGITGGIHAENLDFGLTLGFLHAAVQDGSVDFSATLTGTFANPNGDGTLTSADLLGTDASSLLTFSTSSSLDVELPVAVSLGTFQLGSGNPNQPKIVISSDDVFGGNIDFDAEHFDSLLDFSSITPADVLNLLRQAGNWLNQFRDTDVFNTPIPFTGGKTLRDALDVGRAFNDKLTTLLVNPDGSTNYDSAQTLADKLGEVLGLTPDQIDADYDPAAKDLTFHLLLHDDFPVLNAPLNLNLNVGPLANISTSASINVNAAVDFDFVFGVYLGQLTAGQGIADRFFIKNASLAGNLSLDVPDIDATARVGFVDISVTDGLASGSAGIMVNLKDPSPTPDGRITLPELTGALAGGNLADLVAFTPGGSARVDLQHISVNAGLLNLTGNPTLTIDFPDVTNPSSLNVQFNGDLNPLAQFQNLSLAQIVSMLHSLADQLTQISGVPALSAKLPVINKSIGDALGFVDEFLAKVDAFTSSPAASLQGIETALESALGTGPSGVTLSLNQGVLDFVLDLGFVHDGIPQQFNLELGSLAAANPLLQGLTSLVDLSASGNVQLDATAALHLHTGLDFSNGLTSPIFFVGDDTNLDLQARLAGTNLNFDATIGPLALFVRGGHATVDANLNPGDDSPLDFRIGLNPASDGRYSTGSNLASLPGNVTVGFTGAAEVTLPLFFPDENTPLGGAGSNVLSIQISDLKDPSTVQVTTPDISAQFSLIDLLSNLGAVVDGVDKLLATLQSAMQSQVLSRRLPMIGDKLKDGADFIQKIRDGILTKLGNQLDQTDPVGFVKQKIFDALGSQGGLDILDPDANDAGGDGQADAQSDVNDVLLSSTSSQVEFDLRLKKHFTALSVPVDFDIGIPGLGLSVDPPSGLNVALDLTGRLIFGVSRTDGFYVDTSTANEFDLGVDVTIPNFSATGQIAFLKLQVGDDPTAPSHFSGHFAVDLTDPVAGGTADHFSFGEAVGGGFALKDVVHATFSGSAAVNLDLTASFDNPATNETGVFPSVGTDFALTWGFSNADTAGPDSSFGSAPQISFNNVRMNLGSFISHLVEPILDKVKKIIEPIKPVVDVLNKRLPVLSDISASVDFFDAAPYGNGDGAVTLLEVANRLSTVAPQLQFVSAVARIFNLIENIPTGLDNIFINFGSFNIGGGDVRASADLTGLTPQQTGTAPPSAESQIGQTAAGNFFNQLTATEAGAAANTGIQFPFIKNPASLIGLFMGKTANLFLYDMPALKASFSMNTFFPLLGPLGVTLSGNVLAQADFAFGYDSSGLQQFKQTHRIADVFNGFFVSDRANSDGTGDDVPEVTLKASVEAFGSVNAIVAEAGVGGGITATILGNLNDPDGDGKVRINEIIPNLPLCVFDIHGELTAGISAFVKIGVGPLSTTQHFDIATVTLLEFDHDCDTANNQTPILATLDPGSGYLTLNMGPHAADRQFGDVTDGNETFTVSHKDGDPDTTVTVSAFGFSQVFNNVTRIVADGGAGNDVITLEDGVNLASSLSGGVGNDRLFGGNRSATLHGGDGDDQLNGRGADDSISGDAGNDLILGDAGNDFLDGGDGSDQIQGQAGDDTVNGGAGDDFISGGDGKDSLFGDAGNDEVNADDGNDTASGGAGDDTVLGGAGNDSLSGELGNDALGGQQGGDTLSGGAGDDFLDADEGNDRASGDAGNDQIEGGDGNDTLTGGTGDDEVGGGEGNDSIDGGAGDDRLEGEAGNDTVNGGTGADDIDGGAGADLLDGGDDNDSVHGGLGDDTITGGDGADLLVGDSGNDSIAGDDGADSIEGGDGADTLAGGAGSDTLRGQQGADLLSGGDDDDHVFGDAGADTASGGEGDDELHGGADNDLITGDGGNDAIFGDGGADQLHGNAGNDTVSGGADDDAITGDDGGDRLLGDDGNDNLQGNAGNDYADGGDGNDLIAGNDGNDTLLGLGGADTMTGDAGNDAMSGGDGNDVMSGGAGADTMSGDEGNDAVTGDTDNDVITGGSGNDTLAGNDGDDSIQGNAGADSVDGGGGNDDLHGGSSAATTNLDIGDVINGGDGNDTILGDDGDLPTPAAAGGDDLISGGAGDDLVFAQGGNDTASGDAGNDTVQGNAGDDRVFGNAGDDLLGGGDDDDDIIGGAGADRIDGGAGHDVVLGDDGSITRPGGVVRNTDGSRRTDARNATIATTIGGNDTVTGGDGHDRIFGQGGNDQLSGDAGDDDIIGGAGSDAISGGAGFDVILGDDGSIDTPINSTPPAMPDSAAIRRAVQLFESPTDGDDTASGDAGDDALYGQAGNDRLSGGDGMDYLEGNQGADNLSGGDGDDDMIGGSSVAGKADGSDTLDGGAGHDVMAGDNALITRRLADAANHLARYTAGVTPGTGVGAENNAVIRDVTLLNLDSVGGDDSILGGTGDDTMFGGLGDDRMFGQDGNDDMIGHLGADLMDGGAGSDGMVGDKGTIVTDLLDGSTARTLSVPGGSVSAVVNAAGTLKRFVTLQDAANGGNDTMTGGAGEDFLHGGAGDDLLRGDDPANPAATGCDAIFGDAGADVINGGGGADHLYAGSGNDTADGGSGGDIVYGGDGQDSLLADASSDRLIDWFGNFNTFVVPVPGNGAAIIIRSPDPALRDFLLDLARGDGATDPNGEASIVDPPSIENSGPG